MLHSRNIRLWFIMTITLLASMLTVQAQDVVIRRKTTTTTTSTTTVTTRPAARQTVAKTGTLKITSTPADAAVKIDGQYMGTTPLVLSNRKAGTCEVTVSAEGYVSQTRSVTVRAGQTDTCNVTLQKKQTPAPTTPTAPATQPATPTTQTAPTTPMAMATQSTTSTTPTLTSPSQTFTVGTVSFTMVRVEGGTFTMGATSEQGSDIEEDEKPTHSVTLSTYYIGETEVTQALWQAVMGSNPSYFKGDKRPVECVSWDECQTFISRLNSITGQKFRLPTEAEWEYAARGGNKNRGYKYSGGHIIDKVAWHAGNSHSKSHNVKTKLANELGIYDMTGNVWEWCSDWYGSYRSSSQTNPNGAASGSQRVNRGGSWYYYSRVCRISRRGGNKPEYRDYTIGLRLAL